jgi:hypothetical protein
LFDARDEDHASIGSLHQPKLRILSKKNQLFLYEALLMAESEIPRWPSIIICSTSYPDSRRRRYSWSGKFSSRSIFTTPFQQPEEGEMQHEPHIEEPPGFAPA